ncbi:Hypothetical predicted protein [Octopus vulgaris]|uniref:Uncharacterized protein n=1 Tax=Octopus vulgaris TaxID=6645 RepID=A0AA36FBW4_OCTVU|nr:Hypothetical predicted protein [Octopus vulgaris]
MDEAKEAFCDDFSRIIKGEPYKDKIIPLKTKSPVGPFDFENPVKQLKECKFSLIVDGTTDVNTKEKRKKTIIIFPGAMKTFEENFLNFMKYHIPRNKGKTVGIFF